MSEARMRLYAGGSARVDSSGKRALPSCRIVRLLTENHFSDWNTLQQALTMIMAMEARGCPTVRDHWWDDLVLFDSPTAECARHGTISWPNRNEMKHP